MLKCSIYSLSPVTWSRNVLKAVIALRERTLLPFSWKTDMWFSTASLVRNKSKQAADRALSLVSKTGDSRRFEMTSWRPFTLKL